MNTYNKPAGFLIRLIAYFIDIQLFWATLLLFLYISGLARKGLPDLLGTAIVAIALFGILGNLLYKLYLSYTTSTFGATIGKMLVGVVVKNEQGKNLTIWQGFFRYIIGYMVSSLLFGLGFLWIIKDPKKQGWHDMVAGSYVTKTSENRWIVGIMVLIFLLAFNGVLGVSAVNSVMQNTTVQDDVTEVVNQVMDAQTKTTLEKLKMEFEQNNESLDINQYFISPTPQVPQYYY